MKLLNVMVALAVGIPTAAEACIHSITRNWDWASPASRAPDGELRANSYLLGEFIELRPMASPEQMRSFLAVVRVVKDYGSPARQGTILVKVPKAFCAFRPRRGNIGKIALRQEEGQLPILQYASWSF